MPKQITVFLGGREYTIKEKPTGAQSEWRKQLRATSVMLIFESFNGFVTDLIDIANSIPDGKGWKDIDFGKAIGVARVLPAVVNGLANSVDDIKELIFAYEPKLRTERKWLEENAYDSEFTEAFLGMLKLTFPIMGVLEKVSGFKAPQTPSNSPSPNGTPTLLPGGPKKGKNQIPAPSS